MNSISIIEFKNVSKDFSSGKSFSALHNVSFAVPGKTIFGVIGQTGAGKSTLLRFVNLLEQPSEGSILFRGKEINHLKSKPLREHRANVGMVFQQFHLVSNVTVFDNIALPLKAAGWKQNEIQKRVTELLELVGIPEKINSFPKTLSGGQKQRVGIARALANNPSVLLCDEPTSALDPETTSSILSLLKKINSELNVTIMIVTHEMEVVRDICDYVAVMDKGKLAEIGSTYDVFAEPKAEITRKMIGSFLFPKLSDSLLSSSKGEIFRILLKGKIASDPVLATVFKNSVLHPNILSSNIEYIAGKPIGVFYIEVNGSETEIQKLSEQFVQAGAEIEELIK
ncbi:methionine ABC transporter ATP-binding protein [Leptospira idonii]|uniref:methionine ABC transporter ATP-binding protein n=1 Tax=Leptospira idonii TaxID=1193500 RepID=UPI001AEF7462|nr:ATP-binding cassette domain-containing protein [Leptospira idonii]